MFNEEIKDAMDDREIFAMISKAQEFEQLKVSFIISIYLINQQVLCYAWGFRHFWTNLYGCS